MGAADVPATRSPPDLGVMDLEVEGDKTVARRFALFVPTHLAKNERVPLLVLLHGLGETFDTEAGVFAWVERYGLGTAYARLRRPPVGRTSRRTNLFSDAALRTVNDRLSALPFRGMAIACPFTPNIHKLPVDKLDGYAQWVADVVIPRARSVAPVIRTAHATAIDGVSLGGLVGLEVLLRRPDIFGAWGSIQGAFSSARLPFYADHLAKTLGSRPREAMPAIRLVTSDGDPFLETNTALAQLLAKRGVETDFMVGSGPHDQVFLREAATLEMLLWHDRRMR
jgi:pimeloyl-ACP methyl ester carboxylesterase